MALAGCAQQSGNLPDEPPIAPPVEPAASATVASPPRFYMTQNGERMTADDFDAWLRANGYSAGPRADPASTPAPKPEKPATTKQKATRTKKKATATPAKKTN
jgi:hypothetical protein